MVVIRRTVPTDSVGGPAPSADISVTLGGHHATAAADVDRFGNHAPRCPGGSRQRRLPEDLRLRIIEVRSQLFTRGYFDPVLARFDTATVAQASNAEVAEELEKVAAVL